LGGFVRDDGLKQSYAIALPLGGEELEKRSLRRGA
jgi:hypothetical protein